MKVKELIEQLQKLDPGAPVFVATDEEWNDLRALYEIDPVPIEDDHRLDLVYDLELAPGQPATWPYQYYVVLT